MLLLEVNTSRATHLGQRLVHDAQVGLAVLLVVPFKGFHLQMKTLIFGPIKTRQHGKQNLRKVTVLGY